MKRSITLTATLLATLLAGGAALAAAPKSQPAPKSEKQESKRKERSEKQGRKEKGERREQGEKGEGGAQNQAALAREAKVTMEQARATALGRASGNVEGGELEREHGQLVYSFDIRNPKGTITEVQVNAMTGKIARVEHENKKQETSEKRIERREKSKK